MNRVAAIAWNTFREAVRNKILYSLLFFAVLIIVSAVAIGNLTLHEEVRTIRDIGLFGIDLFGVIIAIFVGVNLLYKELDLKTVYTILPKPLWRWEFVLGKWLGMLLTLAVQMGVMGAVLALVLAAEGGRFDVATAKAVWLLFINVMMVTSIAVFFSAFSSPFLSGFFALGCFVVGRSVPDIRALGTKLGAGSRAVLNVLCDVMPNMHLFYPSGAIVGAEQVSVHRDFVGMDYILSTTGYGLCYSLVVLLLAMLVFRKRDFV
jgi:ABC-type transport system involved in multi-copper enzyme maturation permease subunit